MTAYPNVSFRIDIGPDKRLGPGKVRLLELIAAEGSISAAARGMGMSYRRAWLLIEEANILFAAPLVESSTGGAGGGGARLTPLGHEVIAAYRDIAREARTIVQRRLARFPGLEKK